MDYKSNIFHSIDKNSDLITVKVDQFLFTLRFCFGTPLSFKMHILLPKNKICLNRADSYTNLVFSSTCIWQQGLEEDKTVIANVCV